MLTNVWIRSCAAKSINAIDMRRHRGLKAEVARAAKLADRQTQRKIQEETARTKAARNASQPQRSVSERLRGLANPPRQNPLGEPPAYCEASDKKPIAICEGE